MQLLKPRSRVSSLIGPRRGDLFDILFRQLADFPASTGYLSEPILWSPAVELVETEEEFILSAELPGINRDAIEVAIEGDVLTLKGTKEDELDKKDRRYRIYERSYGSFERSFTLPRSVDPEKIRAEFENGVLEIRLPKAEVARGRKIEIEAGS